jgi:Zn-dependent protease with chaperone function
MTAASTALPLVVALAIVALATSVHRRLPPRLAARFVVALVVVAIAAIPTTLVIAIAFLAHAPVVGIGFEWCARAMGLHGSMPAWIGVPAVALVLIGTVRTVRLLRQHRQLRVDEAHPVHIAHSHSPYAVTLPGRAGQIVISTAMVEMLDEAEQRIVVAHERAHAHYRHDRYLLVSELVAAALPPLRALSRRVSYSVERWADEAAAKACGDRQLVAITLGRVALQAGPPTVAGFSGLGVASRMNALLQPPVKRPNRRTVLLLWTSLAVTAGLGVYQLHHLERLLTALCPH